MVMKKRRIEIVSVTEQRWIIRSHSPARNEWCTECGEDSLMIAPDDAARLSGASARAIYRWVEAAEIHFLEEPDNVLLVCLASVNEARARTFVDVVSPRPLRRSII
jgi:hypothetical protein